MAAIFYGTVTCNDVPAGGASLKWNNQSEIFANAFGQYAQLLPAGNYAITASHNPCGNETKAKQFYDNDFHRVDFNLT